MTGKIFINYRRDDDPGNAGRLFDHLKAAFKPERLFMDVDSIAPGLDFVRVLEEQVAQCDVMLSVIGPRWLGATDQHGNRRLDNPNDFVRIEIEAALKQDKLIIPVLVGKPEMPRADELPETMKLLTRRNAVRLTNERFHSDAQRLVTALEHALEKAIQYYSCFIGYSPIDRDFADRLYADLRNKGVPCWFDWYHLSVGGNILDEIYTAIQLQDKMLLILSEHSLQSASFKDEIAAGLEEEEKRGQTVLLPIRIDDAVYRHKEPWLTKLRMRFIGDFRRWKGQDTYKASFERLVRDLIKAKDSRLDIPDDGPEKRAEEQERDQQRPQNRRSFASDPGGPFEPPRGQDPPSLE
jgi:hypothetical protein